MDRRREQPEPKPGKQVFYGRLWAGYTKEQAMLSGSAREKVVKKHWWVYIKKYTPTYSRLQEDERETEYSWIDITYSKDEARVFRKEFHNVIENLEWKIRQTDDKESVKELNEQLEMAQAELDLFNIHNKWD